MVDDVSEILSTDALEFPFASDALAFLESGGQVIYADGRDDIASIIIKNAEGRGLVVKASRSHQGELEPVGLAPLPESVPKIPQNLTKRGDVLLYLTNALTSPRSRVCALSSDKGESSDVGGPILSAQGMGGLGKTVMASLVARSHVIRKHFTRISFLSLGLEPDILSLQRAMYSHLSGGKLLPSSSDPTILEQRALLQKLVETTSKQGEVYLLVLDDCWSVEAEAQLNVFDTTGEHDFGHRVLITTRTARLIPGSQDIPLGLLSEKEGQTLLSKASGLPINDDNREVMKKIVLLCGKLPLFVNLVG